MKTQKITLHPVPATDVEGIPPAEVVNEPRPERLAHAWAKSPELTNESVQASLDELRRLSSRIKKKSKALSEAIAARDALVESIERNGSPDWNDDAALQASAHAKHKLEALEAAIPGLDTEMDIELREKARACLMEAARVAVQILTPQLARCEETLTAVMLTFAASKENAASLARKSDTYRVALRKVQQFSMVGNSIVYGTSPESVMRDIAKLEAVLSEALKPHPDLQQFLGVPADASAETPE